MKNISKANIATTLMFSLDEFNEIVATATEGLIKVEVEDGILYFVNTKKAEETNEWWNEKMLKTLSKYFDADISSVHTDNCECATIFLICRTKTYEDEEYLKSYGKFLVDETVPSDKFFPQGGHKIVYRSDSLGYKVSYFDASRDVIIEAIATQVRKLTGDIKLSD